MGTATLLPNADVANSSWTRSAGGVDYSLLNDSSDSTYLTGTTSSGYLRLDFATTTIPAGAVVKSVSPRIRAATTSGTGNVRAYVYESANASLGSEGALVALTTSITNYIVTAATTLGGHAWTQALIDGLSMFLYLPSTTLRVYELALLVLYAEVPTVSGVTVTNYTSSTPTVSWTYTQGADGGPQTRYEIKLFDSATYGAGGFSPDTSTPAYSVTAYSSATSQAIPAGYLVSNATYKAYVRVAASPVAGGSYQTSTGGTGSGWAVSSSFTVAVDPPAPVTLTVTPDQANNRVALVVQGHDNLLTEQDGNLETAGTTGTWAARTNCTVAQSTTQAISPGTGSLRLSSSAAGDMEARTATGTSGCAVDPARGYRIRASFRAGATTRSAKVGVRWYDAAGTIIGSATYSSTVSATSGGFTEATADVTSPAGAEYAELDVYIVGCAGAAELFYCDHLAIQESAGNAPAAWYRGGLVGSGATAVLYYLVERSDDGGTTYATVFRGSAVTPGTNQLAATLYDFAWVPGTEARYRASAYYVQSSATTTGATSAGSQTATLDLDDWRLVDVVEGTQITLDPVSDDGKKYRITRGVFDVLDAEYPVVVKDRRKANEATLVARTSTLDDRDDLLAFLRNTNTYLLQGPGSEDGGSRWVEIGDVDEAREVPEISTDPGRLLTLPYVTVAAPVA